MLCVGLMCELLWSDPQPLPGRGPSKRGVGLSFGADVTKRFLKENNLGMFSIGPTLTHFISSFTSDYIKINIILQI